MPRNAGTKGPQRLNIHGQDEDVEFSADESNCPMGDLTGRALIEAMRASPHREIEFRYFRSAASACELKIQTR